MAEPTIKDVMAALQSLTMKMSTMEAEMATLKEKSSSSAAEDGGVRREGPRDLDLSHPGFKGQSRVHLIHAPKNTTYIITECIEINVII
jgi:hypothetical protein